MSRKFWLILFWGSMWGLTEATAGFFLHLWAVVLPGLPGFLMFPIAFYFMFKVYKATGESKSVLQTALVAAVIKLADFLVPGHIPILVINPALAILMEGFAVSFVIKICRQKNISLGYLPALMFGICWRSLFLIHLFIISLFELPAGLVTSGLFTALRFLILESFINSLLIYAYLRYSQSRASFAARSFAIKPEYAYGLFILAVSVQLMI
jgi:hypothetical protein